VVMTGLSCKGVKACAVSLEIQGRHQSSMNM
jgi:hypothetical protein